MASNEGIAIKGFELGSQGFLVDKPAAEAWVRDDCEYREVLKPYMNGDDLKRGVFDRYVIDFFGLTEQQAREYSKAYQHVLDRVISDRAVNRDERLIRNWWLFRRAGTALRLALCDLPRFIGTTRARPNFEYSNSCRRALVLKARSWLLLATMHSIWAFLAAVSMSCSPRRSVVGLARATIPHITIWTALTNFPSPSAMKQRSHKFES